MPRKARIDAPGALHHIIVRGIERRNIFDDDTDRINFMDRLGKVLLETDTKCFSWALIPNHFHLLLRTGACPLSTIMRRLLTGHAMNYNRRHRRSGQLFQNRYKSILCQEDTYLLELVRYIHLNPIRARIVTDIKALDKYSFCGHAVIMGKKKQDWQDDGYVLKLFDGKRSTARRRYKIFVQKGIQEGKRPDLTGGGLIRSSGGWFVLKSLRRANIHFKSDERVLGDSDFVERVLKAADETLERKYELQSKGYNIDKLSDIVAEIFSINPEEIFQPGKQPVKVKARSLFCYWAVRELGFTMADLAPKLNISQPAVSMSTQRGEQIASENESYNLRGVPQSGYCLNNPISFIDPLGLDASDILPGIRKALIGGAKGGAYAVGEAIKFVGSNVKPSEHTLNVTIDGATIFATASAISANIPATITFTIIGGSAKALKSTLYSDTPCNDAISQGIQSAVQAPPAIDPIVDKIIEESLRIYIETYNLPRN